MGALVAALAAFSLGVVVGIVLTLAGALAFGYWITRDYPR
jgi:hypothetical protein